MSQPHQATPSQEASHPGASLKRELAGRHIQLIAIGGCIGTGLFMGSGKTISLAGPSVVLVYAVIGFMLFFLMRAMGELLLSNPNYKSFADAADDLLGPWAGFVTGWSYWFAWIVTAIAEVIAIAGYMSFWWPDLPLWIPAVASVIGLVSINLLTVKAFGEIEFWFALIKIIAILSLIVVGIAMVAMQFVSPEGVPARVDNLWSYGGLFPHGVMGMLAGFETAVFAFVGMEIVGTTAAEVKDPERVMPNAINTIPIRILLFYIGTLLVLMMVTPWPNISATSSPFVGMFSLAGFLGAAAVVNFVVVSSALSSTNSGIYSTSRMLYGLAWQRDAAALFGRLSQRGVPVNALLLAGILLLSSAALLAADGTVMDAFQLVGSVASLLFIFIWTMILLSYLAYRRRRPDCHRRSQFKMPGGRPMAIVVLLFFLGFLITLTLDAAHRSALLILPLWFGLLGALYFGVLRGQPHHRQRRRLHGEKVHNEKALAAAFNRDLG